MKNNYYFTFGQQYRDNPHPKYERADPDGWVRIVAESEGQARQYGFDHIFGPHFSTSYSEERWNPNYFPKGEIECFEL